MFQIKTKPYLHSQIYPKLKESQLNTTQGYQNYQSKIKIKYRKLPIIITIDQRPTKTTPKIKHYPDHGVSTLITQSKLKETKLIKLPSTKLLKHAASKP